MRPLTPTRRGGFLLAVAAAVAATVLTGVPGPAARPALADTLPPSAVIVRGRGHGHGRGMSQYGALGWATTQAKSWQEILGFYYDNGHTLSALVESDASLVPGGAVTVRLETLDARSTSVISDNATLQWAGHEGHHSALVAVPAGRNLFDIWAAATPTCAVTSVPQGFTKIASAAPGPVDFVTTNGSNPAAVSPVDLAGLCLPPDSTYRNGRIRYYRGTIRATVDGNAKNRTVNEVPLEAYLRGVVPRESPAGWGDQSGGAGMNALRAQAVAARSYAASEKRYSYAKTCDSQNCQVYGGAATRTVGGSTPAILEDPRTDTAVAETSGVVIRAANGAVARTEFTSSNGGRTAGGTFAAKADEGDLAGNALQQTWARTLTAAAIQAKYPSVGVLTSVVTSHDSLGGEWGGYAATVTVTGTAGTVTRKAWDFRSDWDLNSPWFDTQNAPGVDPAAPAEGSILYIGDSVSEGAAEEIAAIVGPAYPGLVVHACAGRGLVGADCIGTPAAPQIDTDGVGVVNAVATPAAAVVALGYNDDQNTVESEVRQVLAALTAKGVPRIVFVNLSTRSTTRTYARTNAALAAAAAANPSVSVLDWNSASGAANQWRWFDNASLCCWVHLNTTGQTEFALFLRGGLDDLRARGLLPSAAAPAPVIPGLPLGKGDRGPMVRSVQLRLNAVLTPTGQKKIATDGAYGSATAARVAAFQAGASLPATGSVDRATWEALGLAAKPSLGVLRKGTRHDSVKTVQRALAKVLRKKIRADGVYGSATVADVKTFQRRAGLAASGRVGPATWTVLMETAARA